MQDIRVDIVSDIVCPWCIIGYHRLAQAIKELGCENQVTLHWHPFELNPAMPKEGQNLREHLGEKYGTSVEASIAARKTLTDLGAELGFEFNFADDSKIYNTRLAHQLLMWAQSQGKQHDLQLALFKAYFTDQKELSDPKTLLSVCQRLGLSTETAAQVLAEDSWAQAVASTEQQWIEAGINAVPAYIFNQKHLVSGAQPVDNLKQVIQELTKSKK
ncbi:DsbA family oxidoreductase [Vibrio sonorensis]|uniref:DsbA family oxidoreductase n=1 Tax=Vibrio sonorensis TaxID=1004316 RepID=UPI0008DAE1EA|nr:DsbA family oxidoreductase [Vibrio sonorensis]